MTRESIPRFDLYAELEVSRSAAPESIEAAHRAMAKRHHPDVALATGAATSVIDAEARIKRINVARDWLLDPERRARYDRALRRREGGPAATGDFEAEPGRAAWTSFGPNADHVREFLGALRDLDERRAIEVRDGRNAIDADDYAHARRAAFAISRSRRLGEWLFARDAAAGVVQEQLGSGPLARDVGDVLAEIGGAIAVRDLLPTQLFQTLMEPWTYRGRQVAARASRPPITMSTVPVTARAAASLPAPVAASPFTLGLARSPRRPREPFRAPRLAMPLLAASTVGLILVATLLGASSLFHPFTGGVAGIQASGGDASALASSPLVAAGQTPAPVRGTPQPSALPPGIDPAQLAALQDSAANAIAKLRSYQARGLVKSAGKLLGDTAPGLLRSGLARATFPDVAASDISVAQVPGGWLATTGTDSLSTTDGSHWTFDYGARPLAHYPRSNERDLFWIAASGGHRDILVTITSVTVTSASLVVGLSWQFGDDACPGCDGSSYAGDELRVSAITAGDTTTFLPNDLVATLDGTPGRATVHIPASIVPSASVTLDVSVVNPLAGQTGGRPFTTIETSFSLDQG